MWLKELKVIFFFLVNQLQIMLNIYKSKSYFLKPGYYRDCVRVQVNWPKILYLNFIFKCDHSEHYRLKGGVFWSEKPVNR